MNLLERVNDAFKCGQNCINTIASNVPAAQTVKTIALCAFAYIAAKSDSIVVEGAFWTFIGVSFINSYFKPFESLIIRNIQNVINENFDRIINVEPFQGSLVLSDSIINFQRADGNNVETTFVERPHSLYMTFHHNGYNFNAEVFSGQSGIQALVQIRLNLALNNSAPSI